MEEEKENPEQKGKKKGGEMDESVIEIIDDELEGSEVGSVEREGFTSLICPLCLKFQYKCVTAFCGHSFCEKCLEEYLIIKKVCPFFHY